MSQAPGDCAHVHDSCRPCGGRGNRAEPLGGLGEHPLLQVLTGPHRARQLKCTAVYPYIHYSVLSPLIVQWLALVDKECSSSGAQFPPIGTLHSEGGLLNIRCVQCDSRCAS